MNIPANHKLVYFRIDKSNYTGPKMSLVQIAAIRGVNEDSIDALLYTHRGNQYLNIPANAVLTTTEAGADYALQARLCRQEVQS